jgi:hypothetical protein
MARYRVLEKSFINNRIVEEGDEVEYEGKAGSNLEPLDKPKRSRAEEAPKPDADPLV